MINDAYADTWRCQERLIVIAIWSRLHQTWLHRTVAIFCHFGNRRASRGAFWTVGSSSNGRWSCINTTPKREIGTAQPTWSDRTTSINIEPRSWHTIAVRSRPDRPTIWANSPQIGADSSWDWSHDQRQLKPLPWPQQSAPTTASNGPNFRAKILFKIDVFSPLFLTFWLIREAIKRISRKISSSSWSPRVWTRLRSSWSGIDLEFFLDFIEFSPWIPNVHEEESEEICFNPRELKPHSCGTRVSSDIRSIIRR